MNAVKQSEIAVLVSVRIDPTSGRATRCRADAAAVALAQQALGEGREPWLCTAGDMPASVARDYLAQGVSQLTRLWVGGAAGLDEMVSVLEAACLEQGLVMAGPRGESGLATGLLPYALARRLQRPVINEVIDLVREPDRGWRIVQALPRGARRSWRLDPGVPAVLVTSARLALREDLPQRHSWAASQAGRIVDEPAMAAQASKPEAQSPWRFEPARKQRRPLAAASNESGAARMARATGSADSARQGGLVIRDGSALDKARLLLEHLQKLSLVSPSA
jgi:electron transfer flavoprotein beta subunit